MAIRRQAEKERALSKQARQNLRKKKGTLKQQQVQPVVRARYMAAVQLLLQYWTLFSNAPSKSRTWDESSAEYIEHLYAEGDSLCTASDTLAGIQYMYGRTMGHLKESWKLTAIWRKVEPPRRVLPFLPIMALGMAGAALHMGMPDMAALIRVGFNVFLRTSEMLTLRVCSILFHKNKASLTLHETKTGKRKGIDERVTVTSRLAVQTLKVAVAKMSPADLVSQRSPYAFRKVFKELLMLFDLGLTEYNVYSLRRGGATAFFAQSGSMDKTMITGRWEHSTTARIYINEATAQASEMRLTQKQTCLLHEAANYLK
jgi:integrase